jgi:PIN domain nuclease of toxin-antitoxin system
MILLDTHIWIWWMNGGGNLTSDQVRAIDDHAGGGMGISPISCWEVAMLVARGRLALNMPADKWVDAALTHPAVTVMPLTPAVAVDSVNLPNLEHRDPADRFLIATARANDCPLLTNDHVILAYPHVKSIGQARTS